MLCLISNIDSDFFFLRLLILLSAFFSQDYGHKNSLQVPFQKIRPFDCFVLYRKADKETKRMLCEFLKKKEWYKKGSTFFENKNKKKKILILM